MKIALGTDHAGAALGAALKQFVCALGHEIIDLTPAAGQRSDYPNDASAVAVAVARHEAKLGILVCGSGIGMSIAANKVASIRAALVHDAYTARMSRLHNDANILCLGERVTGVGVAEECARIFLDTAFEGGRHQGRLDLITKLEAGDAL